MEAHGFLVTQNNLSPDPKNFNCVHQCYSVPFIHFNRQSPEGESRRILRVLGFPESEETLGNAKVRQRAAVGDFKWQ